MAEPRVVSWKQAVSSITGEFVSNEYAAANPDTTYWRTVTRDVVLDDEAIVTPINAPEEELSQDEVT